MSIVDFKNIRRFFNGSDSGNDERDELFNEVAMLVLARATSADTNIKAVEVEKVQQLLEETTGNSYTTAEIRTAANSELFETMPLERYVSKAARRLSDAQRVRLIKLLATTVHSDDRVSYMEIEYFNKVCRAMSATPAEILGLVADDYAD